MSALLLIFAAAGVFILWERIWPGRDLPTSHGWLWRSAFLNACQLAIVLLAGATWSQWLQGPSLLRLGDLLPAPAQGAVCWFVGTFVFYWWHRARHRSGLLWRTLHQIHHSAARIETLTAFYKHPLEIAINSVLSTTIVFVLLGASVDAAPWYNLFAAVGEFYYHANIRTPRWTGWFLQRPEHHSLHHQLEVHSGNYGDITWWDRLFGTFRDADAFATACGFGERREERLGGMLAFADVHASARRASLRPREPGVQLTRAYPRLAAAAIRTSHRARLRPRS